MRIACLPNTGDSQFRFWFLALGKLHFLPNRLTSLYSDTEPKLSRRMICSPCLLGEEIAWLSIRWQRGHCGSQMKLGRILGSEFAATTAPFVLAQNACFV